MTSQEIKTAVELVISGQANLVDVRRDEEWEDGHAQPALHFDSKRMEAGEVPEIDKTKPVYLYCNSGGRAGRMKLVLENKGFTKVHNPGGLKDWQQAGGE